MPFAWIIIVILWWIVSAISKAKKNQTAQAKQQAGKAPSGQNTVRQHAPKQAQRPAPQKPAAPAAAPAMSRRDDWEDEEENCYVGRTQYDAPGIDNNVILHSSRPLTAGEIVPVTISDAFDYDLVGEIAD